MDNNNDNNNDNENDSNDNRNKNDNGNEKNSKEKGNGSDLPSQYEHRSIARGGELTNETMMMMRKAHEAEE